MPLRREGLKGFQAARIGRAQRQRRRQAPLVQTLGQDVGSVAVGRDLVATRRGSCSRLPGRSVESSLDRAQKEAAVANLNAVFSQAGLVVVTHNTGLTVAEVSDLRGKMREAGATFKIAKNRLIKIALRGTPYEPLNEMFLGPTAIAYSEDVLSAAKVVVGFAKQNDRLVVLGGAMGETAFDADGIKALAAMPSLDELRGTIVGLLAAPATKVAAVLQAPAGQLARVFGAYGSQGEAA